MESVNAVFVYGTLKSGQCREQCWPVAPLSRKRAWTQGRLYDTGPYPAMVVENAAPNDWVGGQLWLYEQCDMPKVLSVLDEIEDYNSERTSGNLYDRISITCFDEFQKSYRAFTYVYARLGELAMYRKMKPSYLVADRLLALWPDGVDW